MRLVRVTAVALCFSVALCAASTVDAASFARRAARGKIILTDRCGRCHATGATGDSPMTGAPPMREVYARFSPRELQAELSEGMVSHYSQMPQIDFSSEDVDAILAYLYALAVKKPHK